MNKKLYDRKISFIDANKERVNLEIQIRECPDNKRKPYGELSICSQSGQWKFAPDTDEQKALLEIWDKYHLNGMSAGTDKQNDILKKANAPDVYEQQCDELRNYDFNGNFMLDMKQRHSTLFIEEEYKDLHTLKWYVLTLIEKDSKSCKKKFFDLLLKIVKEDKIGINFWMLTDYKKCILFKEWYKEWIISFEFPKIPKSKESKEAILLSIDKRIKNFPTDNLSAIFDIDRGELMRYGCTWVVRDLPEDLPKTLDLLCDEILEDMKSKTKVADLTYEQFVEKYPDFRNPVKVYALACNQWGYLDSLDEVEEHDGNKFHFEWCDWLVCTEKEADQEHLDYMKSIVDDMGFDSFIQTSVSLSVKLDDDGDIFISKSISILQNERGNSLNHYDGYEYDVSVNGTTYYIYQQ